MITIKNRFFPLRSVACFVIEGGIIITSLICSLLLLDRIGIIGSISLVDAVIRGITIAVFCQSCMYLLDLYDLKLNLSWGELFFSVVFAAGFFCVGIGLISLVVPVFGLENRIYYITIVLVILFLMTWRIFFYFYIYKIAPQHNIMIIGNGKTANLLAGEIMERKKFGFNLIGFVAPDKGTGGQPENRVKILGGYDQIGDIVSRNRVQVVVVATDKRRGEYPIREMLDLRVKGYQIVEWQSFFEKLSGRIPIENLTPSFFIFNEGFEKSKVIQWTRRTLSFLFALVALIFLSPFFVFIPLLIRMDSPGRIFYLQERVGLNGKPFQMIKFRSMVENSERETGPLWAIENDPRITRIGKYLRKYRIDEIPQLLNVLKSDLDLIGPRPERPSFVTELEESIPFYSLRHTVRPGVTGWAQVMFPYGGTVEESKEKLEYDLFYVKNMSVRLDLLIIIRTVKILLLGRGSR